MEYLYIQVSLDRLNSGWRSLLLLECYQGTKDMWVRSMNNSVRYFLFVLYVFYERIVFFVLSWNKSEKIFPDLNIY
jgi:hypothetical protein